jgi:indole-3-glycerol phosphate synthase
MDILNTIAEHKRSEVAGRKELYPVSLLERSRFFQMRPVSLTRHLLQSGASGIIAEFKRKSPSKGFINAGASLGEVTTGYVRAGASAISVLTDGHFFGGKNEDLTLAREWNSCPVLRKDFIVDPYQVIEARSIGADAILLIAKILTPEETLDLATLAHSLGMETILEVHGSSELGHLNEHINILGVNNRNLTDFTVSLDISLSLSALIPDGIPAISESGIRDPADVIQLRRAGYQGFLIGEQFMATGDPAAACRDFISKLTSNPES